MTAAAIVVSRRNAGALLERRARGRDYACIRGLPRDTGIAEAEHGYACAESNAEGRPLSIFFSQCPKLAATL